MLSRLHQGGYSRRLLSACEQKCWGRSYSFQGSLQWESSAPLNKIVLASEFECWSLIGQSAKFHFTPASILEQANWTWDKAWEWLGMGGSQDHSRQTLWTWLHQLWFSASHSPPVQSQYPLCHMPSWCWTTTTCVEGKAVFLSRAPCTPSDKRPRDNKEQPSGLVTLGVCVEQSWSSFTAAHMRPSCNLPGAAPAAQHSSQGCLHQGFQHEWEMWGSSAQVSPGTGELRLHRSSRWPVPAPLGTGRRKRAQSGTLFPWGINQADLQFPVSFLLSLF